MSYRFLELYHNALEENKSDISKNEIDTLDDIYKTKLEELNNKKAETSKPKEETNNRKGQEELLKGNIKGAKDEANKKKNKKNKIFFMKEEKIERMLVY